jgi:hypothetical protein
MASRSCPVWSAIVLTCQNKTSADAFKKGKYTTKYLYPINYVYYLDGGFTKSCRIKVLSLYLKNESTQHYLDMIFHRFLRLREL